MEIFASAILAGKESNVMTVVPIGIVQKKDEAMACKLPNECRCSDATKKNDTTGLCGQPLLIRTP